MDLRRFLAYSSGLLLFAMSVATPAYDRIHIGDTNRDHQVNVQDVQIIISEILRGGSPCQIGDINGDGRVDVLDFQFVLLRAIQARTEEEPSPKNTNSTTAIPSRQERPQTALAGCTAPVLTGDDVAPAPCVVACDPLVSFSPRTERYLFTLTAHAPPVRV